MNVNQNPYIIRETKEVKESKPTDLPKGYFSEEMKLTPAGREAYLNLQNLCDKIKEAKLFEEK